MLNPLKSIACGFLSLWHFVQVCRQFNIVRRCLTKRQFILRCTFQRYCLIEL
ncbi:TPA: DUF3709 domain-containing protein [Vibrio cholerae]